MIELNLLPDVKREFVKAQRSRRQVIALMIFISIVAAGLVVLIALYVYGAQLALGAVLDNNIRNKSQELSQVEDLDNYLTIQNQLAALPELHDGKMMYSRLFDYLPVLNPASPNEIRISRLSVDPETNSIVINGNARDFRAVTVFENTLQNAQLTYTEYGSDEQRREQLVESVAMSETALSEDVNGNRIVVFTATMTMNEAAFDRNSTRVRVSVPNLNTTQSAQRVPQQVFGGSASESEGGEE